MVDWVVFFVPTLFHGDDELSNYLCLTVIYVSVCLVHVTCQVLTLNKKHYPYEAEYLPSSEPCISPRALTLPNRLVLGTVPVYRGCEILLMTRNGPLLICNKKIQAQSMGGKIIPSRTPLIAVWRNLPFMDLPTIWLPQPSWWFGVTGMYGPDKPSHQSIILLLYISCSLALALMFTGHLGV